MPWFPFWHKEAGSPFPAKCTYQIPQPGSSSTLDWHLAQQQVHFGVKRCFFSVHWIPPPQSPARSAPLGFVLALHVLESGADAAEQAWEGTCPRSRIVTQLLPVLPRSTAALSYKILCCSNRWEKKNPQAVHARSSSACNDCWVMDLHGDNFELLSALKPCSLLCAGNEMCWLPLPGSHFSLPSLAGVRQGSGAAPAAQQRWAVLGF